MRRLLLIAASALGGYLLLLLVLGWVLSGCVEDRVRERLERSLDAEVDIDDLSVGLIRGRFELRGLHIHRERGGALDIRVDSVDADVAGLGWVLLDRDVDRVVVRGVTMELSAAGALTSRDPTREPMHIGELIIEDARLSLSPTALLPALGRVDIAIDHARTGPFTQRNGASWVFALRELVARVDLPGGVGGSFGYRDGRLSIGGGLLGAAPLELEFALPEPDPEQLEPGQLAALARSLARALLQGAAVDWLERTARDRLDRLLQ